MPTIQCVDIFVLDLIDFMFKDKRLTDSTDLLSPNNLTDNDKVILNYFLH